MRRRLLVLLVLLGACKAKPAPPPVALARDAAAPTASASAPVEGGVVAATDEDKQKFQRYVDAIGRGRRATLARKWPEALRAFDDALALRPLDARARAEKGYAELLSGDVRRARVDLQAASATLDPTLGAEVWFNLGLADEADHDADGALADFWFANKLHPSAAAQKKIAGRTVCPVKIDATRRPAVHATSWLGVARLMKSQKTCGFDVKTDADAKAAMLTLHDDETPPPPAKLPGRGEFYVVRDGKLDLLAGCVVVNLHVLQVEGHDFWLYPADATTTFEWDKPVGDDLSVERVGDWIVGQRRSQNPYDVSYCTVDGGDPVECRGEPGEQFAYLAKLSKLGPPTFTAHLLDAAAHAELFAIDDQASGRFTDSLDGGLTHLRADGDSLVLEGWGCSRTFSRGDAGAP